MKPLSARTFAWSLAVAVLAVGAVASPGRGQELPVRPIVLGDGRVTLGGDASLTVSCAETPGPGSCGTDTGFFNYSDYEHSTLRMLRVDVNASVRATPHLWVLAEVRSENGASPRPYALYVRVRPWQNRRLDIQVGRVPPTFGAFARRSYANDNILIGYPLAYQYLTSLRPDSVPASSDELFGMRGRGWLSHFSLGNITPDRGVPLISAFRFDTGVQVHSQLAWGDVTGSITNGSLANPLVGDDNAGKQFAGRVALHPRTGLLVGLSAARGSFLTSAAARSAAGVHDGGNAQSAIGADIEYSRDYYLVRVETIASAWTLPTIGQPLRALAVSAEGRYKFSPRFYAAGRYDHLGFSAITGSLQARPWDAAVTRVEIGGGYLVTRNIQLKTSGQINTRDGGRVSRLKFWAAQTVFWF